MGRLIAGLLLVACAGCALPTGHHVASTPYPVPKAGDPAAGRPATGPGPVEGPVTGTLPTGTD